MGSVSMMGCILFYLFLTILIVLKGGKDFASFLQFYRYRTVYFV